MLKSITESEEAIFFRESTIRRTYENFLNDISKANKEINNKIKKWEVKQSLSIQKSDDILCKDRPKVYTKK